MDGGVHLPTQTKTVLNVDNRLSWGHFFTNRFVLSAVCFTLLFLRRGSQLLSPQVWAEDGTYIVQQFAESGLTAFIQPVEGYLVLVPKLISFLAIKLSFFHYPEISTYLCWLFTIFTFIAISVSPTSMKGGILLGIFTMLIPSGNENFGIPLYSFWWSGLLLFLVVLWKPDSTDWNTRLTFLILGGLSSPLIVMLLPLLIVRACLYRRREIVFAFVGLTIALIQCCFIFSTSTKVRTAEISFSTISIVLKRFLGHYLIGNLTHSDLALIAAGIGMAAIVATLIVRHRRDVATLVITYLWLGAVALSFSRVESIYLQPVAIGRYFYYPYILTGWFLVHTACIERSLQWRIIPAAMLALSAVNVIPVLGSRHVDLSWSHHVASSINFDKYRIPIHTNGEWKNVWTFEVTRQQCQDLLSGSIFGPAHQEVAVFPCAIKRRSGSSTDNLEMIGPEDFIKVVTADVVERAVPNGRYIYFETSKYAVYEQQRSPVPDEWGGEIVLRLKRGDAILFLGHFQESVHLTIRHNDEPCTDFLNSILPSWDWRLLEFSNEKLPDEFRVAISKENLIPGEWFSVALRPHQPN